MHRGFLGNVKQFVERTVFVIIPRNKLDELRVEHDTGISIKDGRAKVSLKVSGNKGLVTVSKESLHFSLRLALDDRADLLVGG